MRVDLVDGELRVANTGAPLDAPGVAALASLRASAKRDRPDTVGRFGVGFAAVLAVSDAPAIVGPQGGVAFSAARTAEAVAALPGPAAELARRGGHVPVLRLVWPAAGEPPPGYDTEVRLPLREGVDGPALLDQAAEAAPDMLLALPGLVEIGVGERVLRRLEEPGGVVAVDDRRWRVVRRAGRLDPADAGAREALATLAVEQRERRDWSVTWALPLDGPQPDDV
ncbi:MAG TPA: ATP-binding protein, partial [Pseudonocardia sp.]|nr:ATP-binding protein [Pseudonocardia sp.]